MANMIEGLTGETPPYHWLADEPVGVETSVDASMLAAPFADRSRWLHYSGNYRGHRHSPLESLNPETVGDLAVVWAFPPGTEGQFSVSPVVYGGVMYVTTSFNHLFALDARTGAVLWRYDHPLRSDLRVCCGPASRGVSIQGDYVYMGTLDAQLMAFERRTGRIAWQTKVAEYTDGYAITSAPLVIGDQVITGIAGGEFGIRGFVASYDATTGKQRWRHYTVPAAGEPGVETWAGTSYETGGAPTWTTGTYDATSHTLFWTTGNPSPDFDGDVRAGDNLFADSVLAIDPDSGARKWHFQFTPHNVWDLDGNTHVFLVDIEVDGKQVQALAQANRNGFFYLLDRRTGEFLFAKQYVEQLTWAEMGADGRPIVDPDSYPSESTGGRVCPGNLGGTNGAWTGAFNPDLGLAFVSSIEHCSTYSKAPVAFIRGLPFVGGMPDFGGEEGYGLLSAIDVATGTVRWRYRDPLPMTGGALSTAGGVVFSGTNDGEALALDSATGKVLWRFRLGSAVRSQPIAYELDGRPYVAIASGASLGTQGWIARGSKAPLGGVLMVFSLPPAEDREP